MAFSVASTSYEENRIEELRELVKRLMGEHRDYSSQTEDLNRRISDAEFASMIEIFAPLREALINHMLEEETEIFPELSRRGLFTERTSEIMQQHVEITAALDSMRFAIHRRNLQDVKSAFNSLLSVMHLHFPAEEREVFQIVIQLPSAASSS